MLAWVSLIMLLITPIEAVSAKSERYESSCKEELWLNLLALLFYLQVLGQASFLVLIAAFIQPAELPFFAMLEREL